MKFENGSANFNKYLDYLSGTGLLVSPLSEKWLSSHSLQLGCNYAHYKKIGLTKKLKGQLLLIECSTFTNDDSKELCTFFPAFKEIFNPITMQLNPDLIAINLKTKQILVFGLVSKNKISIYAYMDRKFETILATQYDSYINYDFEYEDEDADEPIAADPKIRYLQEFCDIDFCEITDNLYNALEGFGIAAFRYAALVGDQFQVVCAESEGADSQGNYIVDGEVLSSSEFIALKKDYEEFSRKANKHLEYLKIFFPHLEWSDLCTGAF